MTADSAFEHQVSRLFAQAPAFADQARFTDRVRRRLERRWRARRLVVGAAGVLGGLVAALQLFQADVFARLHAVTHSADHRARDLAVNALAQGRAILRAHDLPVGGEVVWMVSGLAAVGLALVAARVMDTL